MNRNTARGFLAIAIWLLGGAPLAWVGGLRSGDHLLDEVYGGVFWMVPFGIYAIFGLPTVMRLMDRYFP